MKKGFSLLEVLFCISFLTMVGVAVLVLNVATLRLITDSEIKTTAQALNDEAISFLEIKYKADPSISKTTFNPIITNASCKSNEGCYLKCSTTDMASDCTLQAENEATEVGKAKLTFVRHIHITITSNPTNYIVLSEVSWGTGVNKKISASYYLQ